MCRVLKYFFLGCLFSLAVGCAQVTETAKTIWGTSTAALERARADASRKTYQCSFSDCYAAVLGLGRTEEEKEAQEKMLAEAKTEQAEPAGIAGVEVEKEIVHGHVPGDQKFFDVFLKDPRQGHIVVIGIQGNVDTTEVGIFFEETGPSAVKIEISSLSTTAKRRVAQAVFDALDKRFPPAS